MTEKPLSPSPELSGELTALFDNLNSFFYDGTLPRPMFNFRSMTYEGCIGKKGWNHHSGPKSPEFCLNPVAFKAASYEKKCMEFLRLMEHLRRRVNAPDGKLKGRTNYHDRDFAKALFMMGLQTHRAGQPDKETGERITFSVIPGGKFEKFAARKPVEFSWAIAEDEKPESSGSPAPEEEPRSSSGKTVKYVCPQEGCATNFRGRSGQRGGCFEHEPPVEMIITARGRKPG